VVRARIDAGADLGREEGETQEGQEGEQLQVSEGLAEPPFLHVRQ
jgi:hypothetical protein